MSRSSVTVAMLSWFPLLAACGGDVRAPSLATEEQDVRACAGRQVDVSSDRNNCGRCGQACGPKETCQAGHCAAGGGGGHGGGGGGGSDGGGGTFACAATEQACGSACCPVGNACGQGVAGEPECIGTVTSCGTGETLCSGLATEQNCCPSGSQCSRFNQGPGATAAFCFAQFPQNGACATNEQACGAVCCLPGETCATITLGGTPVPICE